MPDLSHLDQKYFIDEHVYNCPFCNRRNVSYWVEQSYMFNWTNKKECHAYIVICRSCNKRSMHLSYERVPTNHAATVGGSKLLYRFDLEEVENLDDCFFYSVPSSFFVLDESIPGALRELFTEGEGCLKSNFLTGGSACARKIVYELAEREGAEGVNYEDKIKSLKGKFPGIDPVYFDTLLTIQQVTSDKVHEDSYDGWVSKHLRLILATLAEILREIYVLPKTRESRRQELLDLKERVLGGGTEPEAEAANVRERGSPPQDMATKR